MIWTWSHAYKKTTQIYQNSHMHFQEVLLINCIIYWEVLQENMQTHL